MPRPWWVRLIAAVALACVVWAADEVVPTVATDEIAAVAAFERGDTQRGVVIGTGHERGGGARSYVRLEDGREVFVSGYEPVGRGLSVIVAGDQPQAWLPGDETPFRGLAWTLATSCLLYTVHLLRIVVDRRPRLTDTRRVRPGLEIYGVVSGMGFGFLVVLFSSAFGAETWVTGVVAAALPVLFDWLCWASRLHLDPRRRRWIKRHPLLRDRLFMLGGATEITVSNPTGMPGAPRGSAYNGLIASSSHRDRQATCVALAAWQGPEDLARRIVGSPARLRGGGAEHLHALAASAAPRMAGTRQS